MPDDLEAQLKAFGATLESEAGESITHGAPKAATVSPGPTRRWWAIGGAAACVLVVIAGLVLLSDRVADAPSVAPAVSTSTSTPQAVIDPELLRTAPIADLATGCDPIDVLVSGDSEMAGTTVDEAFTPAQRAIVDHTPPGEENLPLDGWTEVAGDPVTVRYLDRGRGLEGIVRIRREADGLWRVTELAHCVKPRLPAAGQTTTSTVATLSGTPVPDDPLSLERDGWTLVQRKAGTFEFSEPDLPCPNVGLAEFDGVDETHDILTPPDATGLDLDVQVLEVGSLDRGNDLAQAVLAVGNCITETQGITVETGAMSSVRATWFRAGSDFALVAIVGEGNRSIVLEIENAPFDDDLIAELAHRADQFLRGVPITPVDTSDGEISVTTGSSLGRQQVEPVPGQVKLWVSNQSFKDDPVAVTVEIDGVQVVDDSFEVGGQHNWSSFMIDGLESGEHTLIAASDTGATFERTFTLPPDEPLWMVLDYWNYPDEAEGRAFTFSESNEPIYFA